MKNSIRDKLKDISLNLEPPEIKSVTEIDRDKFYIITIDSEAPDNSLSEFAHRLGTFFDPKKGGAVILRGNIEAKDYTIQDLELIRENLDQLIEMVKKKNIVLKSRYQLLKEE